MMQLQSVVTTLSTDNRDKRQRRPQKQMALDSLKAQLTGDIYDIDIEAFSMSARHLKPEILGKVIDNLAQVYNEKTGQKIVVIFRKMADNSSTKEKKYQPTPDEVKQRENKVLSLVNDDGIIRISEIVEKSGVSGSAARRYLLKAGYTVTAGTVSR